MDPDIRLAYAIAAKYERAPNGDPGAGLDRLANVALDAILAARDPAIATAFVEGFPDGPT